MNEGQHDKIKKNATRSEKRRHSKNGSKVICHLRYKMVQNTRLKWNKKEIYKTYELRNTVVTE